MREGGGSSRLSDRRLSAPLGAAGESDDWEVLGELGAESAVLIDDRVGASPSLSEPMVEGTGEDSEDVGMGEYDDDAQREDEEDGWEEV